MKKVMIAPSILSGNFARIEEEVRKIEEAGADMIHLDVMDGNFVENITFGPKMVADIRKITKLPLDAHLMISNPRKYYERFIEAGADYVTIHVETDSSPLTLLEKIREGGAKCGIAFNPDKHVDIVSADCYRMVDLVLVMSVFPGFSGQKYIDSAERVRAVRERLDRLGNPAALIQIDGGINLDNAPLVHKMGADILVTGNTFFLSKNPKETVENIKNACTR